MTGLHRVTIASRVFCIAVILGLGIVSGDKQVLVSLMIVAIVATTATYVSLMTPLATALVVAMEAAVIGVIIGLALPASVVFLPYLIGLSLIVGISQGIVGVSGTISVQFFAVPLGAFSAPTEVSPETLLQVLSPWLLMSIGLGLLGCWLHSAGVVRQASSDTSYEAAHRLLTQLRTVARRLSSGLDPLTIADHIRDAVTDAFVDAHAGVFVRTEGGVLSPLSYSDDRARELLLPTSELADDCWAEMEPRRGHAAGDVTETLALPLRVASRMIGIVLVQTAAAAPHDSLDRLMHLLDEHSLRLDTALTFDEIRSTATVEERHRLAREIHDGIAQEVASLGYQVDELIAAAESAEMQFALRTLRQELTRVVSELRLSIFDLRSDMLREIGLGSALSAYVRQVGSRSTMTVHLTLDEAATRLRAETEAELLRIAQEAIYNARKHSGAKNLWVDCRVDPPFARLQVRDDGTGISPGRSDSYGLRIMQERADRIDARLDIECLAEGHEVHRGTSVSVTIGERADKVSIAEGHSVGGTPGS